MVSRYFPDPALAPAHGLIGVGGKLDPAWLVDAYSHGIFPWPSGEGQLAWWSPDPRAVIELDQFHISRRLSRTLRSGRFELTMNRAFASVVWGCASAQDRRGQTWITRELAAAYLRLHRQGLAHSVEAWSQGQLVGGVYGVALGGMFAGESMFYRVRDASKVALAALVAQLRQQGYVLFDIQQTSQHTVRLGAREIPRREFLARVERAIRLPVAFGKALVCDLPARPGGASHGR